MTTTTAVRISERVTFRGAAAHLRSNAGIDHRAEVEAVQTCADLGAAARRLRASNVFTTDARALTVDGAVIALSAEGAGLATQLRRRHAAGAVDGIRRQGRLAGRAGRLLADIAAVKADALREANGVERLVPITPVPVVLHLGSCVSDRSRERIAQRRHFREAAGFIRSNAGVDGLERVAAVHTDATVGSAARRLRASVAA